MDIPPKDELKKKYGITNDDFDVLTESPPEETIWKQGWIEIVESISGVKTGLWRSWAGKVLAVIVFVVFPPTSIVDLVRPIAIYAATEFLVYIEHRIYDQSQIGVVAFLPQNTGVSFETGRLQFDQMPVGTGLFPASGQYIPV